VSDVALAAQLQSMVFLLVGLGLIILALYLRLRVFIGGIPGGVDTWYYLASAEALRKRKRLPISLPQYLFHDPTESYAAGFPILLALLPPALLRHVFWLLSPLIDVVHLLLLYLLSFRLTDSVLAAGVAGLIYAVTPQLIAETRNLNPRSFASLLLSLVMLALVWSRIPGPSAARSVIGGSYLASALIALVLIAILYNSHTSTAIALGVSAGTLSIVFGDPYFIVMVLLGLPAAVILSGGYYISVLRNHVCGAQFWIRNVRLTRAHQILDSPVLGTGSQSPSETRGLYALGWKPTAKLAFRVLGENPFIIAMLVTPVPKTIWGAYMYWWAVAILGWATVTTFVPFLRVLGPGFQYMKASIFPTAYTLAITASTTPRAIPTLGLLISIAASFAAIAYFYRVMALRETEHTAQAPPELARAAEYLLQLPGKAVMVLPWLYADYICYNAKKSVVWGGHSGHLGKLEEFFPVIRKPLPYFFEKYHVDYLVLDAAYASLDCLRIESLAEPLQSFGNISVFKILQPGQ
jgi:hypothetical protein